MTTGRAEGEAEGSHQCHATMITRKSRQHWVAVLHSIAGHYTAFVTHHNGDQA